MTSTRANHDVVALAEQLLACPSVTPATGAVFTALQAMLEPLGFTVDRFVTGDAPDGPVENLLAWRTTGGGKHFAFAGHLDVVPPGPGWTSDPFVPEQRGDLLYGRGAVDMKGSIAAFVAALHDLPDDLPGTISLIITGDEEGPAVHGTLALMETRQASVPAHLVDTMVPEVMEMTFEPAPGKKDGELDYLEEDATMDEFGHVSRNTGYSFLAGAFSQGRRAWLQGRSVQANCSSVPHAPLRCFAADGPSGPATSCGGGTRASSLRTTPLTLPPVCPKSTIHRKHCTTPARVRAPGGEPLLR